MDGSSVYVIRMSIIIVGYLIGNVMYIKIKTVFIRGLMDKKTVRIVVKNDCDDILYHNNNFFIEIEIDKKR